jgi:hypothetical protein
LRKAPQACGKISRRCERAGVQLRIAAGQPAAIGALRRLLVGQRRERKNLRAGRAPRLDKMRVDEAEGTIIGERNALARRR